MTLDAIRRAVVLTCACAAIGSGGLLIEQPVAANETTCCTYASDCAGQYDICCSSNCNPTGKSCQPCKEAGCHC